LGRASVDFGELDRVVGFRACNGVLVIEVRAVLDDFLLAVGEAPANGAFQPFIVAGVRACLTPWRGAWDVLRFRKVELPRAEQEILLGRRGRLCEETRVRSERYCP